MKALYSRQTCQPKLIKNIHAYLIHYEDSLKSPSTQINT